MANIRQALLVEDREAVATELESLLSKLGFKVTTIQEPESVAQILESREYEVALMNMTLPGMNWRRTMLTVKSAARTTTIIAVKESPDEVDADRETCRPISVGWNSGDILKQLFAALDILPERVLILVTNLMVAIAMTRNFVSEIRNLP